MAPLVARWAVVASLLLRACTGLTTISMSSSTAKQTTLYDVPVSNNGARCRIIIYKKSLNDSINIVSPMELGGLRSDEYLAINPQGKMPTLTFGDSESIPESDTICRYLLSEYVNVGPSFQPDSYQSNTLCRIHDIYLTTIQGCLYKNQPPFGIYATRKDALAEFVKQLQVIDNLIHGEAAPYLCGSDISLADATLFPTMVFAKHMLPKFGCEPALPSKLNAWFESVQAADPVFKRVYDEIDGGLRGWENNNRWDSIFLAGVRDEAQQTLFDKIIAGDIPAAIVKEDDNILAFKDINPASPAHVVLIPKDRAGLTNIRKATPEHVEILGRLMVAAGEIANEKELGFGDGARIVINDGPDGGQEVNHLHLHVLGGRPLSWPPG